MHTTGPVDVHDLALAFSCLSILKHLCVVDRVWPLNSPKAEGMFTMEYPKKIRSLMLLDKLGLYRAVQNLALAPTNKPIIIVKHLYVLWLCGPGRHDHRGAA
jgi:hypothetical protein